ncbi:hypothetical protein BU15DRAFT_65239 [Melanogaster broomeanus]|nr:hypothetical protein BU15DRAFT_65239 [Melanogaster broomeanus]
MATGHIGVQWFIMSPYCESGWSTTKTITIRSIAFIVVTYVLVLLHYFIVTDMHEVISTASRSPDLEAASVRSPTDSGSRRRSTLCIGIKHVVAVCGSAAFPTGKYWSTTLVHTRHLLTQSFIQFLTKEEALTHSRDWLSGSHGEQGRGGRGNREREGREGQEERKDEGRQGRDEKRRWDEWDERNEQNEWDERRWRR